jgi:hypothetical protein
LLVLTRDGDGWAFTSGRAASDTTGAGGSDPLDPSVADIVDVVIEPVRPFASPSARYRVVATEWCGSRHVLAVGRRRQMERVASVVRAELNIGPDPLGRAAYPPRPRRVRVERQIGPTRVTVTLPIGSLPLRICGNVLGGASICLIGYFVNGWTSFTFTPATVRQIEWDVLALAIWAAVWGAWKVVDRRLGRRRRPASIKVTVDANTFRPGVVLQGGRSHHESWPINRVVGPRLNARPGERRADLSLLLDDGTTAPLVNNGPALALSYMRDTLSVALARSAPPQGVGVDTLSPERAAKPARPDAG